MGMYRTRQSDSDSLKLDTRWLKTNGYLCGFKTGGTTWTDGWGHESSIGFSVETSYIHPNIRFQYILNKGTEEEKEMDYSFPLIQVPCNLRGYRWAFRCTLSSNGVYCGRTVYTLYKANSDYFGCRHCMRIVYDSQRECGKRFQNMGKLKRIEEKIEDLHKGIHKGHYRGNLTRKVRRLAILQNMMSHTSFELEQQLIWLSNKLSK